MLKALEDSTESLSVIVRPGSGRRRCMQETPRHKNNRLSVRPDNVQWLVNRDPVVGCKTCKGS
jgi:hypothetical protein